MWVVEPPVSESHLVVHLLSARLRSIETIPICRTCGALVDLTRRNEVMPVVYRGVLGRDCGVICILEGSEQNVEGRSNQTSVEPVVARGQQHSARA